MLFEIVARDGRHAGQGFGIAGQTLRPDQYRLSRRIAEIERQGIGRRVEIALGAHHQGTAADQILVVLGQQYLRPRAKLHLTREAPAPAFRQRQQVAIGAQPQAGRDPVLIGVDRPPLHPDRHRLTLELRDVDIARCQGATRPALVHQPVAQQGIERPDLHLAQAVGVVLVLIDRKVAPGDAVAAIDIAAIVAQRAGCARRCDGPVIIAQRARAAFGLEHGVERAIGGDRASLGGADLGQCLDDLRGRTRGGAQHFVQGQWRRTGRRGRRRVGPDTLGRGRRGQDGGDDQCGKKERPDHFGLPALAAIFLSSSLPAFLSVAV